MVTGADYAEIIGRSSHRRRPILRRPPLPTVRGRLLPRFPAASRRSSPSRSQPNPLPLPARTLDARPVPRGTTEPSAPRRRRDQTPPGEYETDPGRGPDREMPAGRTRGGRPCRGSCRPSATRRAELRPPPGWFRLAVSTLAGAIATETPSRSPHWLTKQPLLTEIAEVFERAPTVRTPSVSTKPAERSPGREVEASPSPHKELVPTKQPEPGPVPAHPARTLRSTGSDATPPPPHRRRGGRAGQRPEPEPTHGPGGRVAGSGPLASVVLDIPCRTEEASRPAGRSSRWGVPRRGRRPPAGATNPSRSPMPAARPAICRAELASKSARLRRPRGAGRRPERSALSRSDRQPDAAVRRRHPGVAAARPRHGPRLGKEVQTRRRGRQDRGGPRHSGQARIAALAPGPQCGRSRHRTAGNASRVRKTGGSGRSGWRPATGPGCSRS